MVVNGAEVFTKWLGESEEGIRHIFRVARQIAPCIVLLDPLESIAGMWATDEVNRTPERVLSQILSELDSISALEDIVVVGATHRPAAVNPVVLDSGRLGSRIHVPLPDESDRRKILSLYLSGVGFDVPADSDPIEKLVSATEGLSGAEIKGLMNDLKLAAWARARLEGGPDDSPIRLVLADLETGLAERRRA
jgi:transitional endoplasmic reticulum ATPase